VSNPSSIQVRDPAPELAEVGSGEGPSLRQGEPPPPPGHEGLPQPRNSPSASGGMEGRARESGRRARCSTTRSWQAAVSSLTGRPHHHVLQNGIIKIRRAASRSCRRNGAWLETKESGSAKSIADSAAQEVER